MKLLSLVFIFGLVACGSDEKDENDQQTGISVRNYSVDISDSKSQAHLGEPGCEIEISKNDIDSAADAITAGGIAIPFAYETLDGRFYVLIESKSTKSIQLYKDFARVGVLCK